EEPVGTLQQSTREGEALLLAWRQAAIPLVALVELACVAAEKAGFERPGDLGIGKAAGRCRECHRVAEAADGNIGPLGEEEQAAEARPQDLAGAIGPDAGDRAHQRAL